MGIWFNLSTLSGRKKSLKTSYDDAVNNPVCP